MHGFVSIILVILPARTFSSIANTAAWTQNRRSTSAGAALYARGGELNGVSQMESNKDRVELLRFVTAYRTGIEALVDLTPYSPLIRAAAARGNLTFYSFIDTWVSNHTQSTVLYLNNETGTCTPKNTSDGNGWGLSVDLLFWPKQVNISRQPTESITIASGFYGGWVGIGKVSVHKGSIAGNGSAIFFEKEPDLDSVDTGMVYDMNHEGDVGLASLLGYVAQQTELYTLSNNPGGVDYVADDARDVLLESRLAGVHVTSVDEEARIVYAKYNGSELEWEVGMPVFYNPAQMFTDRNMDNGLWLNSSVPMQPVGNITYADGENLTLLLNQSCLPTNATHHLPHLLIPLSRDSFSTVTSLVESAKHTGRSMATELMSTPSFMDAPRARLREPRSPQLLVSSIGGAQSSDPKVRLLEPNSTQKTAAPTLQSPTLLGHLDLETVENRSLISLLQPITADKNMTDGTNVVIITQQRHGLLLNKSFQLPENVDISTNYLNEGSRVIMQLAVTGHGWAATAEQCGEYCHAVYRISLNGKSAANVTQFRDDCKDNPIGPPQYGTWDESRNGWCPGTVVPGIFIDMTRHLRAGSNNLTIDLVVWSNATLQYEPYTDFAGFIYGDSANLIVDLNAFVYNRSTVETILQGGAPRSAAEKAILLGSSAPARLFPPDFVREPVLQDVLLQTRSKPQGAMTQRGTHLPRSTFHHTAFYHKQVLRKGLTFMGKSFEPVRRTAVMWDDEDDQAAKIVRAPSSTRARMARAEIRAEGSTAKNADIQEHRWLDVAISSEAEVKQMATDFDFEGRAPWYLYNSSKEGPIQALRYQVFNNRLVQARNRHVEQLLANASFPDWGHVAVHFRLHDPPSPLQIDHWDRVGSLGLSF